MGFSGGQVPPKRQPFAEIGASLVKGMGGHRRDVFSYNSESSLLVVGALCLICRNMVSAMTCREQPVVRRRCQGEVISPEKTLCRVCTWSAMEVRLGVFLLPVVARRYGEPRTVFWRGGE